MASGDSVARLYGVLTPHERFVAAADAMSRDDALAQGRLDASCPRRRYEGPDQAYRRRLAVAAQLTVVACGAVLRDLEALRLTDACAEELGSYARWAGEVAGSAFVSGWQARELAAMAAGEPHD